MSFSEIRTEKFEFKMIFTPLFDLHPHPLPPYLTSVVLDTTKGGIETEWGRREERRSLR